MELEKLITESQNPASETLDQMTAAEIVALMSAEDARIAAAVAAEAENIATAIDVITDRLASGGRLVYLGAGTSGRLGVLDASECPPTFNAPPGMVVGLIAGGRKALTTSIEGVEDHPEEAVTDLLAIDFSANDVLVGIATSGRTPYVIGGLSYAQHLGSFTIAFTCNESSEMARIAQLAISPIVGPEVVSGSTRLKAGTATKMVLNMLTTGAMVRLGKTYGNLMVDLQAKNEKLTERTRRILMNLTGLDAHEADEQLQRCRGDLKTAVVAFQRNLTPEAAQKLLAKSQGHLRQALEEEISET